MWYIIEYVFVWTYKPYKSTEQIVLALLDDTIICIVEDYNFLWQLMF